MFEAAETDEGRGAIHRTIRRSARAAGWDPDTWVGFNPNGLGEQKPNHYLEMVRAAWRNRRQLPYAWRILTQGACDGCALGTAGLHDWTIDGIHLCTVRLDLLHLNTMGPVDPSMLRDAESLAALDGADLRSLGRLAVPMLRLAGEPGFRPVGWDEALDLVAGKVADADPGGVALYLTSRGVTNEVYYAAQKAWRGMGSPHVDNAARVCHSPSTVALKEMLGVGAATCSYRDLFETDLVVLFGSDVANNQPVMMKYLYLAKRRGARIAVVNPFREPGLDRYWVPSNAESALFGTRIADSWFEVTIGGDAAFVSGVMKSLVAEGRVDEAWIRAHTTGWPDLSEHLVRLEWDDIERGSGLTVDDCRRFADMYAGARRAVFVWSMGITQHRHGSDNVRAIVDLALARGMVGRPGCGLMPIRGHSGVQGGAEMGAYATTLPGGGPVTSESARALSEVYGFPVPASAGMSAVDMLEASLAGRLDVLWSSGGNFLDVLPEPGRVRDALGRVPVRVHSDIVVTSQMLVPADSAVVLLPVATRYEQSGGGTETTTERRIVFSPEVRGPRPGSVREEWAVFGEVARRVRGDDRASFRDAQSIRDEIAAVVPYYEGIQRLRRTGDAVQWGGPRLCAEGSEPRFSTADGKAHFTTVELPGADVPPGAFRLSTRRGKQFNSMVHADVDPLTGARRDAVFMNPADADELGLAEGDAVELRSTAGSFVGRVRSSRIARRNLAVFWPEGNVLISAGASDPEGGVPDYNALVYAFPVGGGV